MTAYSSPSASTALSPSAQVGYWQKGFAFYDRPELYGASETMKSLQRMRATGANYVAPVVTWYMDSPYASAVHRDAATPTDAQISAFIQRAHTAGLRVLLTPHIDTKDHTWRGFITPNDAKAWFASYAEMLTHYADLAADQGVEGLVIGKELVALSGANHTADWISLICQVRSRYHGYLTYSANWGSNVAQYREDPLEEFTKIQFWDYLDYLGVSAYFELSTTDDPSLETLKAAWDGWNSTRIAPFQAEHGMPLLFTEVGYRSIASAAVHPWDYSLQSRLSHESQATLFRAFFEYWSNVPWVAGLHIWNWEARLDAGGPNDATYTIQNKPAEKIISSWFGLQAQLVSAHSAPTVRSVRDSIPRSCGGLLYVLDPAVGLPQLHLPAPPGQPS